MLKLLIGIGLVVKGLNSEGRLDERVFVKFPRAGQHFPQDRMGKSTTHRHRLEPPALRAVGEYFQSAQSRTGGDLGIRPPG